MSAYWEYTLSHVFGWTWGYEAAAVSPQLGYWIWQILSDLSSTDEQLQVCDTGYVIGYAQGVCRIPLGR